MHEVRHHSVTRVLSKTTDGVEKVFFVFFYHVGDNGQLVYDGLGAQLGLADHSRQEASHLEQPPLQAEHEHAGDGQLDEGPPLLHALHGPPCV